MLKLAYMIGVEKAFEEEELEKEAGVPPIKEIPDLAMRLGLEHPLIAKMLGFSALGGATGAALGDEVGLLRGALAGAGLGAGLHAGELLGLGRYGRAARRFLNEAAAIQHGKEVTREFLKQHPIMRAELQGAARRLKERAVPTAIGRILGAGLGGAAGYGLGSALTE